MAQKKVTIVEKFEMVKAVLAETGHDELVEFINERIAQQNKKKSGERKLTPHQLENEQIKEGILDNMEVGKSYTIADMLICFDCFPVGMTPNRLVALLSQMGYKGTNQIKREEIKGKAYFSLPDSESTNVNSDEE